MQLLMPEPVAPPEPVKGAKKGKDEPPPPPAEPPKRVRHGKGVDHILHQGPLDQGRIGASVGANPAKTMVRGFYPLNCYYDKPVPLFPRQVH